MIDINDPNFENDRLEHMLAMQRELQQHTFGFRFAEMSTQERVDYIKENVLALSDELHELLAEMSWKPWAKSEFINEEKAFSELIDAWHFMMNIMIAIKPEHHTTILADEFVTAYTKKREVNVQRQEDGYDGQSTKCPKCKRALDDVGSTKTGWVEVNRTQVIAILCVGCDEEVTDIVQRMTKIY